MRIVKKLLSGWGRGSREAKPQAEHALFVHLALSGDEYGSEDEIDAIQHLGTECEDALRTARAGEFEGEEFGKSECVLCFAGPDCEQMWKTISHLVRVSHLARGGRVVQRFGAEGAREARLSL